MGSSRARTKHLRRVWAEQNAVGRAPHMYNSNSKHQPVLAEQQQPPAAPEQPAEPPQPAAAVPAVAAEAAQQPASHGAVASEAQQAAESLQAKLRDEAQLSQLSYQEHIIVEQQQQLEQLREALSAGKQRIKDLCAQLTAATAQVADQHEQLAEMAAAEAALAAAAAAQMDALEADMARTERKLARTAEKLHTYDSLLADGMMDKVQWLINHPCGLKQLRRLSDLNYFRYVPSAVLALPTALLTAMYVPLALRVSSARLFALAHNKKQIYILLV